MERRTETKMGGKPVTLLGPKLATGKKAPDFTVLDNGQSPKSLKDFDGKKILISVVPSLDTSVCDIQTRKFNEAASGFGQDVVILTISMDLPFAQKRFCEAEGIDKVITLSELRDREFGKAYGVEMISGPLAGLLSRAVVVLDASNRVVYTEQVPEIAQEPNYQAALDAAKKAL